MLNDKIKVIDYFSMSEDGKYFVCLCKIEGNEGQNCNATKSTFSGCEKMLPQEHLILNDIYSEITLIYMTQFAKRIKNINITFCNI